MDPMIGAVSHAFKPLIDETNKCDFPNEQNLQCSYTAGFNESEEVW